MRDHRPWPALLVALAITLGSGPAARAVEITHGVAAGDVSSNSAVIWARSDRAASMTVRVEPATGTTTTREFHANTRAADDFTAQVSVDDLDPGTLYRYSVQFTAAAATSEATAGLFRTAPAAGEAASVRLIWSGDLAGQRYCRRPGIGYRIFRPMQAFDPDFFVANGDMIYADNDCPRDGIEPGWINIPAGFSGVSHEDVDWEDSAAVAEVFNAHWRYNRVDPHFQAFLAAVPMYAQWDDHEVINDFGAPWTTYPPAGPRRGFPNVVAAGRKSLFDYHPIRRDPDEPGRIYRRFDRGAHVDLFLLDARSYRSDNVDPDGSGKTMLGAAQLAWLKRGLAESTATWKIVSNDVPLSVPTGSGAADFGRDAYADGGLPTGFETELLDLVRHLDAANVTNVVFIATDVHSAAQIRYERDYDGDGDTLLFHELIAGPLSAIRGSTPVTLDDTLGPVMLYGEGALFNFGTVRVDAVSGARLTADVRDEFGQVRPGSELVLMPEQAHPGPGRLPPP